MKQALETARTSNEKTEKKLQERLEELALSQKALQQAKADKLSAVANLTKMLDEARGKLYEMHTNLQTVEKEREGFTLDLQREQSRNNQLRAELDQLEGQ
jgi:chromosome segregation ATPase